MQSEEISPPSDPCGAPLHPNIPFSSREADGRSGIQSARRCDAVCQSNQTASESLVSKSPLGRIPEGNGMGFPGGLQNKTKQQKQ